MGKRKLRHARKVRKLIANGGTPFNCSECPRVFATQRDLEHHTQDAHSKKVVPAMVRRHQHQEQSGLKLQPPYASAALDLPDNVGAVARPFTALFTSKKKSDECLVIDFVTPHPGCLCSEDGCRAASLPLTGFCEEHDPLCALLIAERAAKANPPPVIVTPAPKPANDPFDQYNEEAIYRAAWEGHVH